MVEKPGSTGQKGHPAPRFGCCLHPCSLWRPDQLLQGQRWSQVELSLQESQGKLRLAITQSCQALGAYSGRRMGLRWPSTMTARKQHQDLLLFVLPTHTSEHSWRGSCCALRPQQLRAGTGSPVGLALVQVLRGSRWPLGKGWCPHPPGDEPTKNNRWTWDVKLLPEPGLHFFPSALDIVWQPWDNWARRLG